MQNNIAWPKAYIPNHYPIKKIIVKQTKEEKLREQIKENHKVTMKKCFPDQVEDIIHNSVRVAETDNAMEIHKT